MEIKIIKDLCIKFLKQYWATLVFGIIGMIATFDIANIIVLLQGVGIVSLILLFVSLILDDAEGRGLFPHYNEAQLIENCQSDPIASAIIVAVKNLVVITAIVLAYLFIKP